MARSGEAFLRRVARIDSDHLTTSTLSLVCQDIQERAPRGIQNTFCQFRSRQTTQVQVFDNDGRRRICVSLRGLEMKITALALDFQMRLCRAMGHLATTGGSPACERTGDAASDARSPGSSERSADFQTGCCATAGRS